MADPTQADLEFVIVAYHHVPVPYTEVKGHYVSWDDAYVALGQQQQHPDWFTDYAIERRAKGSK